ncbi:hypothetical protein YPPY34_2548, partial [Yersinia pestis PY-34]
MKVKLIFSYPIPLI